MKKLIIAVAVIATALVGQAASVKWSAGSTKLCDATTGEATSLKSGSIVLAILSDTTGWSDGTWKATSGVTELATATVASAKGVGTITGTDYKFEYDDENPTASALKNGDILGVLFKDADGNYSQLTYYTTKSAVTETLTVSGLNSNVWTDELVFGQAGDGKIVAGTASIPEPTSALLLMLGLCGLALKRKNV